MGKFKDLTGQRFGRLTVIERTENNRHGNAMWLCLCDCGNKVIVLGSDLRAGHTRSCKCLQDEVNRELHKTHGLSKTRLHKIWSKMIDRCYNPHHVQYHNYGGRGITICREWKDDFTVFYAWAMANGYAETLSIDRIDNDGNYCPENCQWITMREQQNKRGDNVLVTMNGKTQNVTQWCNELGANRAYVYKRLKKGWPPEKAFFYSKSKKRGRA